MPHTLIYRASNEGIKVDFNHLDHRIHAFYTECKGYPYIVVSKSLEKDPTFFRCVLAEELGHYYTSAGIGTPIPHVLYRDRTKMTKDEYRALRWAVDQLLPIDKLFHAIRSGMRQMWELAEYFRVTEEMIRFRLKTIEVGVTA